MANNFIMLQKEDLEEIVVGIVEKIVGKNQQSVLSTEESDEYYTRDQVCERLHITYTTLWRLEKRGMIPVNKIGRRNLYSKNAVDKLINSGYTI